MRKIISVLAVGFMLLSSNHALAYGKTGHRVVGEIAQRNLTPEAQAAVEAILGGEMLWEASYYPDEMRSSPDPFWRYQSPPLHYINFEDGSSYAEAEKNPKGDAYVAVMGFIETLKNDNATQEEKALALRFLTHLAGDLHQPMHAGRAEDHGGNKIKVRWFGDETNLHTVWDSKLIDNQQLSYTEWVALLDRADAATIALYQQATPMNWVEEISAMRSVVYDVGDGNFSYQYIYDHTPTIKLLLQKGGYRLAGILNEIFAE
ncbi:MAG: S1/P1 nuclease [Sphingomonadales bacterium]|nr:S1/P1 nuclease [Sphingomonadales bacterium]